MYILAQQAVSTAQSIRELSQSASPDALVSGTPGAFEMTLLALGVVVVTVTTNLLRAVPTRRRLRFTSRSCVWKHGSTESEPHLETAIRGHVS